MDPKDMRLNLAGKIAQVKEQKDLEAGQEDFAQTILNAEPVVQLLRLRTWAVQFFKNLKEGVNHASDRLNAGETQNLYFQNGEEYRFALLNQSARFGIEAYLISVPTANDKMPAIQLNYMYGDGNKGEVLLFPGLAQGTPTLWVISGSGTVFGDGSMQAIAEAILRYVHSGSFGISGINP